MDNNLDKAPVDQAMELLRLLGERIGVTVEKLWPHAVRYVAMDALGVVAGWMLVALICSFFAWRASVVAKTMTPDSDGRLLLTVLSVIATLTWLGPAISAALYFSRIVEPTGALVFDALTKVAR